MKSATGKGFRRMRLQWPTPISWFYLGTYTHGYTLNNAEICDSSKQITLMLVNSKSLKFVLSAYQGLDKKENA